jgi:hypothetical protein
MSSRGAWQFKGRGWIAVTAAIGVSSAAGLGFLWARGDWGLGQRSSAAVAKAEPVLVAQATRPAPTAPPTSSSYKEGVVAYIYGSTPVTRADFGEYLIARYGDKLEPFVNKQIVERACHAAGVTVEPGEVEADLAEALKAVPGDKRQFLDSLLKQKQMTLREWKDDVVRPKLLLTKLCRSHVKFTEEDVQRAFESYYGEKVLCQVIIWTPEEVKKNRPVDVFDKIRADVDEFDREARGQFDKKLASKAGQLMPFGRYSQENREMEKLAFSLRDGEVSQIMPLIPGQEAAKCGAYVIKRVKHFPPDDKKKLADVRAQLEHEIIELQLKSEIAKTLNDLKSMAKPELHQEEREGDKLLPPGPPEQVVATINGNTALTREQFGEYLIDRYGPDRLDLYLNHLIVEHACKEKGIEVSEAEVEEALNEYVKRFAGGSRKVLVEQMLKPNKATLYELRHDVLWSKLMLTKFCRDRVQVTPTELRQAFDAHYGEKVRCRMIMWPREEESVVRSKIFPRIRDDDKEFERLAKQQIVPELASHAGLTELARHATGHEEVEKLAFDLQKGDISPVMSLPEGVVVFRVLDRVPPKVVKIETVRAELEQEVTEAKLRMQIIPVVYQELRNKANPIVLIRHQLTEEDLRREVVRELQSTDTGLRPHRPESASGGN